MYGFLNVKPMVRGRHFTVSNFAVLSSMLKQNFEAFKQNEQAQPHAVPSDHLLVKILNSVSVPFGNDCYEYVYAVKDYVDDLTRQFQLHSPINCGKVYSGEFYGDRIDEIVIAVNGTWDVDTDWRDWAPLRVVAHPLTSLRTLPLDGRDNGAESGYAVFALNIAMLSAMYREWRLSGTSSDMSPQQFIRAYVLTNALRSHLDIALINRFIARMDDTVPATPTRRYPVAMPDPTSKIDRAIISLTDVIRYKRMRFEETLQNIPTIFSETVWDATALPINTPTKQYVPALTLARLPLLAFLFELDFVQGNKANLMQHAQLQIVMRNIRSDGSGSYKVPALGKDVYGLLSMYVGAYI